MADNNLKKYLPNSHTSPVVLVWYPSRQTHWRADSAPGCATFWHEEKSMHSLESNDEHTWEGPRSMREKLEYGMRRWTCFMVFISNEYEPLN